ncbi:MAG TPA: methyltransferase domain-containing protein [Hyphomicrobiaceae bacterium]|nr:methyltransferase domain-containing protein [Hyphomicrobiaceae bacterium]
MIWVCSRFAGEIFLAWLSPPSGLRWIDIGCGNGAVTELLVERCNPVEVQGVDPSEGQFAFARTRPAARVAEFRQGDAMALPFSADRFDAAVMALVLVFVPDPVQGVAEMVRVVGQGGIIATYIWDMEGGGFPLDPILAEMRAIGLAPPRPPRLDASRMEVLRDLWTAAGLEAVETRDIAVTRTFADFDAFWMTNARPYARSHGFSRRRDTQKPAARALTGQLPGTHHVRCARTCGEGSPTEVAKSAPDHLRPCRRRIRHRECNCVTGRADSKAKAVKQPEQHS